MAFPTSASRKSTGDNGTPCRAEELKAVNRKFDGMIEAIATDLRSSSRQAKLNQLEHRKAELENQPAAMPFKNHESPPPCLGGGPLSGCGGRI